MNTELAFVTMWQINFQRKTLDEANKDDFPRPKPQQGCWGYGLFQTLHTEVQSEMKVVKVRHWSYHSYFWLHLDKQSFSLCKKTHIKGFSSNVHPLVSSCLVATLGLCFTIKTSGSLWTISHQLGNKFAPLEMGTEKDDFQDLSFKFPKHEAWKIEMNITKCWPTQTHQNNCLSLLQPILYMTIVAKSIRWCCWVKVSSAWTLSKSDFVDTANFFAKMPWSLCPFTPAMSPASLAVPVWSPRNPARRSPRCPGLPGAS